MHSVSARNKRLCTVVDFPTEILASLFSPLMFAELQNQSPQLTFLEVKWSYDPRSYERNFCNCVKNPEKLRTSTGFEPVTSRYRCDALTNWAMKPLTLGAGHLWVPMFPWGMNEKFRTYEIAKIKFITAWIIASLDFISAVHIWFVSYIISSFMLEVLGSFQLSVVKQIPKQLLRPIGANCAKNQSKFVAIPCNLLKAREKSSAQVAIGF